MSGDELTQAEPDTLLAMEKHRLSDQRFPWPDLGRKLTVDLLSGDKREGFHLDMTSSQIKLSKFISKTAPVQVSFWLGLISAVRRIETLTMPRFPPLICIFIERAMEINGLIQFRPSSLTT